MDTNNQVLGYLHASAWVTTSQYMDTYKPGTWIYTSQVLGYIEDSTWIHTRQYMDTYKPGTWI